MAKQSPTKNGFRPLASDTDAIVAEHLKASKEHFKKVNSSKKSARAFLMRVGIIDKNGKLTAPYR